MPVDQINSPPIIGSVGRKSLRANLGFMEEATSDREILEIESALLLVNFKMIRNSTNLAKE